jgi:carboxyl-terminal processing protease
MSFRTKLVVVTLTTLMVTALLVAQAVGRGGATPEDPYRHIGVFSEVLSRIKGEYVEEPDMKLVTMGAINGLLESIDPYASYLNKDQYEQYTKQKDQPRADVGLVLSKRFGYISVVDSIPGSPADKAGLSTGDMIESIAGVATRDMPLAFAEILLKGDTGSDVEITVLRVRKPEPTKLTLTRANVKFAGVVAKLLPDGVGHVKTSSLEAGKAKEIAAAVRDLEKQGAKKLVLDLRNAASGAPEEGIAVANLFMEKGVIASLKGQRVARKEFVAEPEKTIWKGPVAVITNRGTASGAELAAAAILDSKRGEVVGERTYGNAALRQAVSMEDGGAVILAVAKYYSPKDKAIQDNQVMPSHPMIEIEQPETDELDETLTPVPPAAPKKTDGDQLLKKAIEVLAAKTEMAASAAK